jgi:UDP-N-acetyl-D-mannosaminuronate dehydrogenase
MKIAVVGLGYVSLPLFLRFARLRVSALGYRSVLLLTVIK